LSKIFRAKNDPRFLFGGVKVMSEIKSGDDSGRRRKDGGIVPPISLIGLFGCDEGDDADEKCVDGIGGYVNNYENQLVTINTIVLTIRQYSFHRTNANQVWPGTFVLADFISQRQDRYFCHGHDACTVLELGAATGGTHVLTTTLIVHTLHTLIHRTYE
jgi:hypothetical protein